MVAGILSIESLTILGMMMLSGRPPEVTAARAVPINPITPQDRLVEIEILRANMSNEREGVTYIYNVRLLVQVQHHNAGRVADWLDQNAYRIRTRIAALWRGADPALLAEPRLQTLTGQVDALLSKSIGTDWTTDDSVVVRTVILMGIGHQVR
jgi:hypothetical protein